MILGLPQGFLLAVLNLLEVDVVVVRHGGTGEADAPDVVRQQSRWVGTDCGSEEERLGKRCLMTLVGDGQESVPEERSAAWPVVNASGTPRPEMPGNLAILMPHSGLAHFTSRYCLRFDSLLLTYAWSDNGTAVDAHEHYALGCGQVQSQVLFRWSPEEAGRGHQLPPLESMWKRRADLKGVTLKATVVQKFPSVYMDEAGVFDGYMIELLGVLQGILNFRVDLAVPPDGEYGVLTDDGQWTGVVRELLERKADLSAAALTMSIERTQVLEFSLAAKTDKITVLIVSDYDDEQNFNFLAYVRVFHVPAWVGLAAVATLTLACCFASVATHVGSNTWSAALVSGLGSTLLAMIQKSSPFENTCSQRQGQNALSNRVLFLAMNLSFLLIFILYTSDLTATMTASVPMDEVTSFQDILDAGIIVAYKAGTVDESFLALANRSSPMGQVYLKLSLSVDSFDELEENIRSSGGRTLGFDSISYYLKREKRIRPIWQFENTIQTHDCFAFPKGSDLAGPFNHHLLQLHQSGVTKELFHKWFADRSPPDLSKRIFRPSNASPLGYLNLIFPAIILLVGLFASLALGIVEKLCEKKKQK